MFSLKENIPKQLGFKALKEDTLQPSKSHQFVIGQQFKVQKLIYMSMKLNRLNTLMKVHY